MATTIKLDPITRVEGHLKVEVQREGNQVVSAQSSGLMFRGFENLLVGKDPRDAAHITQRVCGVCPTPHAMAAVKGLEDAMGFHPPENARLIRNLILGADHLHSHVLHFYHLTLLCYIRGPAMPPWTPTYEVDLRFNATDNDRLVSHYVQALAIRRQAHEMGAIFGGKLPHTVAFEYGGVTTVPTSSDISRFRDYLDQIINFVDNVYLPDVDVLGNTYPEYYQIGRGYGNLLAFGVFDKNTSGSSKLLARGRVSNASTSVQPIDLDAIVEYAKYSWYTNSSGGLNPAEGVTQPSPDKSGAYSWLKSPRHGGDAYEVGPLARMWVNGDYRNGISVMDRHQARAHEASKVGHAMRDWLSQIDTSQPVFTSRPLPGNASGIGLTEAPRGALGHWIRTDSQGRVSSYHILTPTCWNFSPRDDAGVPGPLENALEGTPFADEAQPVEVTRVVHSFDPCLSCAVH